MVPDKLFQRKELEASFARLAAAESNRRESPYFQSSNLEGVKRQVSVCRCGAGSYLGLTATIPVSEGYHSACRCYSCLRCHRYRRLTYDEWA
jgi:hypothetical protein